MKIEEILFENAFLFATQRQYFAISIDIFGGVIDYFFEIHNIGFVNPNKLVIRKFV